MREGWLRKLLDPENRDLGEECGYPADISLEMYKQMYEREGVGARVVAFYPEECWATPPNVYETEDAEETEWEQAWDLLTKDPNLTPLSELANLDEISGIGHFGVMVIGIDDGMQLSKPIATVGPDGKLAEGKAPKERKLLYLTSFDESLVMVKEWVSDEKSPRNGRPEMYQITVSDPKMLNATPNGIKNTGVLDVHWTRVLHAAEGMKSSKVFGTPRMRSSWNYLLNIRKLLGGSAEMFWKGAFPGLSYEVDPGLELAEIDFDKESAKQQMAAYQNGLQRYISMVGIKVTSLAPQVADPTGHLDAQYTAISIATGIPKRQLMGSEQGELAADEDTKRSNKRIMGRCKNYCGPRLLMPFVDRLIAIGVLKPVEEFFIEWEDLDCPSEKDVAEVAFKLTQAIASYVRDGLAAVIGFREYCIHILRMDEEVVDEMILPVIQDDLLLRELTGSQQDADQQFQDEQGDKDREFQKEQGAQQQQFEAEQTKGSQKFQSKESAEDRKVAKAKAAKPPAKKK